MQSVANLLRELRRKSGLTQSQLAEAAGIPLDTLRSVEQGRRPLNEMVHARLVRALGLTAREADELRLAAGSPPEAQLVRRLRAYRAEPLSMAAEVAQYDWPCLVLNERREILAWNAAANAVAELDIGRDLPTPMARNILRMAGSRHFEDHLVNWDELIGRLIGVLKLEGVTGDGDAPLPPYLAAIVADIAAECPHLVLRLGQLWQDVPPFPEGARNIHPIRWRVPDGTALSFVGVFRDWSLFDGTFAFDWHPLDVATSAWLRDHLAAAPVPNVDAPPPAREWPAELEACRTEVRMTRDDLALRAGLSASSIYHYERGLRRPSRRALLAVCRALTLDGYRINALLRKLGYEEEPSDFARWLAGETPPGILRGHSPARPRSWERTIAELSGHPWPAFLLNGRCEVVYANPAARPLVDLRQWPPLPGRDAPHLLQIVLSAAFRARVPNWEAIAEVVVPGALEPLVAGAGPRKPPGGLTDIANHLRRREPEAAASLPNIWDRVQPRSAPRRLFFPVEWLTDAGDVLRFNGLLTGLNSFDPYLVLDWHPADPATHRHLAGLSPGRTGS